MVNQKSKKRNFNGMSYHEVQRANSNRRDKLQKEDQKWLKANHFKNVGWVHVISLYVKIDEFLEQYHLEETSLDELFLEADRIGNKYQTDEEIETFNQQLAKEVSEIEAEIDRQFPDTEIEVVDFSRQSANASRKTAKPSKR
ncbi:hypothetical protein H6G89_03435 [Oscillatoria sp. FACHB-1407]|uniref:hypothetical protein n=1 Tax=Oscillatoria sp. FACHB-1407 TaxID=2692847 RepID=UPI001684D3C9|nr:hypothetical protein [Oscillatoria sp. FACHB-1407]MBD2460090.1 hypothetical protein [Oscillatoria sp. FACHB-1407]